MTKIPTFNLIIAAFLTMKFIALAVFVASLSIAAGNLNTATAQEVCPGKNLIEGLKLNEPDAYAEILDKAKTDWKNGTSKFWRVERQDTPTSWLYGTAHLTDPRITTLPQAAQSAFDQSNTLLVEIKDIEASAAKAFQDPTLREAIYFTDGSSLEDHLSADAIAAIKARIGTGSTPWFLAKRMRPWLVLGLLAPSACETERKSRNIPILDAGLQIQAKQQNKTIIGLETVREQFDALSGLEFNTQIEALNEIAGQTALLDDMSATMVELYVDGNIGQIWPMLQSFSPSGDDDQSDRTEFEERIVTDRNLTMAERSAKYLSKGSVFLAVGALHLPGEKGLVSLLREQGYIVTEAN